MPAQTSDMYEFRVRSTAQRCRLALALAAWLAIAVWLLCFGGLATVNAVFGWTPVIASPLRRFCLASALSIYYLRLLLTWFVFLKRGMRWQESFAVATWLLCIFLAVALAGGRNDSPFGLWSWLGVAAFAFGSWLNSWAEFERLIWKRQQTHHGQLYTGGLFRYCRHPNYLGDVISYSGIALMTGNWMVAFVPAITLAGFVFANIPALDRHLQQRYKESFDDYAKRTARLIPFVY
ncbi:MAG TPA: DUF1295 domain-containing protein [Acidobacteriaceae bacterium]|jgi:protein-S-isoprenylcysteine O-methyltransferase Ste14|nr:DUF1295 domain-containing protein [Acidobacteriaceae bacterium]